MATVASRPRTVIVNEVLASLEGQSVSNKVGELLSLALTATDTALRLRPRQGQQEISAVKALLNIALSIINSQNIPGATQQDISYMRTSAVQRTIADLNDITVTLRPIMQELDDADFAHVTAAMDRLRAGLLIVTPLSPIDSE